NTISGVNLGTTNAGNALFGNNFGTLTVDHVKIDTNNTAINLTNGAFGAGASFSSVSVSNSGVTDVSLTNVTGSADLGGGSVAVANETGGTVDINGLVTANTSTASAINLATNTGATVQFDGGLNIDTTTGTGFNGTGGGTVRVSSTAGDESINSTSGQALNLI